MCSLSQSEIKIWTVGVSHDDISWCRCFPDGAFRTFRNGGNKILIKTGAINTRRESRCGRAIYLSEGLYGFLFFLEEAPPLTPSLLLPLIFVPAQPERQREPSIRRVWETFTALFLSLGGVLNLLQQCLHSFPDFHDQWDLFIHFFPFFL